MANYQAEYRSKVVSVDEALSHIKSGYSISSAFAGNEPFTLLGNLHKLQGKVSGIKVFTSLNLAKYEFMNNPAYKDTFDVQSNFMMETNRQAHKAGLLTYMPGHLHDGTSRWISHNGMNVYVGAVSPMDKHGYFRMSLSMVHERILLEHADLVIVEVNPNMPIVFGDNELHVSDVDYVVEVNTPIPTLPKGAIGPKEKAIGEYVSTLVNDGDTIQLGIGAIPDAVGAAFMDKHDLGVHTEMITSVIADLVDAGVVTGKKKTLHPRKIVATFALGSKELYDVLDNNPAIMIMDGSYTNNSWVMAQNDNMVSINNGLAVDLTGQVCSESVGSLQYSGTGGQNDTAVGAIHSKNGRSIIALKSTAKNDTISTISAQLPLGSVVTLSRNNLDYVVTEYGIAPMKGRTVRERVNNLAAIAHPNFRAQLKADAEKLMLW
ncbi:acetyl-CoA hydrolase/transferase family protein [Papillibacter cinnamivorans]|uniref:Acyl-CoA hydrolase n=1 Tax=Papillibacter cinnamivorans DSM 12816 TaxID=1122930 RepID=A0A1W1ZYY4_9FIRM|nr:acetyl-CoA hydrolase/transferase C-terminal domain-containing protein [Papillibacter cinnamivorans]SMC53699.1 Acyl-CoA hydrolase [Papillibacter cinnamivorans DSM 12816]